jgi:hypothetical protein
MVLLSTVVMVLIGYEALGLLIWVMHKTSTGWPNLDYLHPALINLYIDKFKNSSSKPGDS